MALLSGTPGGCRCRVQGDLRNPGRDGCTQPEFAGYPLIMFCPRRGQWTRGVAPGGACEGGNPGRRQRPCIKAQAVRRRVERRGVWAHWRSCSGVAL